MLWYDDDSSASSHLGTEPTTRTLKIGDKDITVDSPVLGITFIKILFHEFDICKFANLFTKIAVPENLIQLVEKAHEGSIEHSAFVYRLIKDFGGSSLETKHFNLNTNIFLNNIRNLESANKLHIITMDNMDGDIYDKLIKLYNSKVYEISMSPKDNFVKKYIALALSYCKKTSNLMVDISSKIATSLAGIISQFRPSDCFAYDSIYSNNIKSLIEDFVKQLAGSNVKVYFTLILAIKTVSMYYANKNQVFGSSGHNLICIILDP